MALKRLLKHVSFHISMSRHSAKWPKMLSVTSLLWEQVPAKEGDAHMQSEKRIFD